MPSPRYVARSRTYPVARPEAFNKTLTWPLDEVFSRRFGPMPPITGTDQDGTWGHVGQRRTIHTADGGTMTERLVSVEEPSSFAYEITDMAGPMKLVVGRVEGSWAFEAVGTGTRITWTWAMSPASSLGTAVLPLLAIFWQGYARRALDHLETLLLRPKN